MEREKGRECPRWDLFTPYHDPEVIGYIYDPVFPVPLRRSPAKDTDSSEDDKK